MSLRCDVWNSSDRRAPSARRSSPVYFITKGQQQQNPTIRQPTKIRITAPLYSYWTTFPPYICTQPITTSYFQLIALLDSNLRRAALPGPPFFHCQQTSVIPPRDGSPPPPGEFRPYLQPLRCSCILSQTSRVPASFFLSRDRVHPPVPLTASLLPPSILLHL